MFTGIASTARQLRGTVLFVDDEPDVLHGILLGLRRAPYRTLTAASAREALRLLGRERVDVLVTDLRMPELDGLGLLDAVRDRFPDVVRIALTAVTDPFSAMAALNDGGVFRYLAKPITREQLEVVLHLAFERREEELALRELAAEGRWLREAGVLIGDDLTARMLPSPG